MTKPAGVLLVLVALGDLAAAQPSAPPPEPAAPAAASASTSASADVERVLDDAMRRIDWGQVNAVVRGTVRRARRAVALGPTVGAWAAYVPSPEVAEQAVTFGLALEVFKVPLVPGVTTFRELIEERVRAKVRGQIVDRFRGQPPEPLALDRLVLEAVQEAKAEMLGDADTRAKVWESPRYSAGVEGNYLLDADAWMARLRLGFGISKLTLAGSFAVGFGDDTTVFAGVELGTHFQLSKQPRSSVVDVFVRADFELTDRDTNTDHVIVGARFLLDLI